jgi:hypothetical protein
MAVKHALPLVDSDPIGAYFWTTRALTTVVGQAIMAYVSLVLGDEKSARFHLDKARTLGVLGEPPTHDIWGEVLAGLRASVDGFDIEGACESPSSTYDLADLIPCTVFQKHPSSALDAFALYWGSSRDLYAHEVKVRCADRLVRTYASNRAITILDAYRVLSRAHLDVSEQPDGTMWIAFSAANSDVLTNLLLAPEDTPTCRDFSSDLDRLRSLVPHAHDLGVRLDRHAKLRDRLAPILGEGVCAISASRGRERTADECSAMVNTAATQAVVQWIGEIWGPD